MLGLGEECCCQGDRGHDGRCCMGWSHFDEEQLPDGRIISQIMGCDDCGRFAMGKCSTDDESALAEHDAVCELCRPLTDEDDFEYLPGDREYCRITVTKFRHGVIIAGSHKHSGVIGANIKEK